MPEKLDRCVSGLLAQWKKNPSKAPKQYKTDDGMKEVKGPDDLESAAWGICRASTGLSENYMIHLQDIETRLEEEVLSEGDGPVLAGVAAVNRPYIKFMDPLEVVVRDGKEKIKAQIVRFGIYRHPRGPDGKLPFTRNFWDKVKQNFASGVFGQKIFFDPAHEPNKASLGEVEQLEETSNGVAAIIDPTEDGLDAVKKKKYNYASIDLLWHHKSNLVKITASEWPELEEADLTVYAYNMLLEEEVSMSDQNVQSLPPETKGDDKPKVSALPENNAEAIKLQELLAGVEADRAQLAEEREAFARERADLFEQLRRDKVRVFLSELGHPDTNGGMLDKNVLDLVGSILLGDPIGEDDSIQLSDGASMSSVHAYYRSGVEALARAIPRVVPSSSKVDVKAQEIRPKDVSLLNPERQLRLEARILALQEAGKEVNLEEINEELDRLYGVAGQEG